MLKPLEGLLKGIERADPDARLFFVGDYVNRGLESKGVIDLVLTLKNARFIRGNHDDIFDQVLQRLPCHPGTAGGESVSPQSRGDRKEGTETG